MPHVSTQILDPSPIWQKMQAQSAELHKPAVATPRRRLLNDIPSLSLLVTSPDNPHWDFGPIRHIHKGSESDTPTSGSDSVFELPSAVDYEDTPNSSTHSLFVAELEDTSPYPFKNSDTPLALLPGIDDPFVGSFRSSRLHTASAKPAPKIRPEPQLEIPPLRSARSPKTQSHLHPNSPAATRSVDPQVEYSLNSRSARSSHPQSHLYPGSSAPITAAGPHLDPPNIKSNNSDFSMRPSYSPFEKNSDSTISVAIKEHQMPPKPPPVPRKLRPSANIKSRAEIAIENITAIEEANRHLLVRALAAEQKAKILQEMNLTLQNRVVYCDQQHRPKTAPSRRTRETTPISTFNTTPTRSRPAPLNLAPDMKSASCEYDLASRGSPTLPLRRFQLQLDSQASDISGPIPGSVIRQQVTYRGKPIPHAPPIATISLTEARLREKPLPFIMPMSPSAVPGFVEMGNRGEFYAEERKELRKKKTFADLFRRGKRQGVFTV